MNKHVPFLDLITPHLVDEEAMLNVCREALRTGRFIGGPMVEEFEQEFAAFCNAKYCVGVGSGTDALRFGMIAAGIRSGDIVITVPNTFIATTEAISQAGATPMFIDVDPQTSTMDPKRLQQFLEVQCETMKLTGETAHIKTGRRVSAVVPVHLYGQTADMDAIRDIAERYRLIVVEDACQAHGAEYYSKRDGRWRKAGSMGTAAAFSFYPGKNLGACGEAGALTTNDEAIAGTVRMLRDHGQTKKYVHEMEGYNGRLDAIQAGFLQVCCRVSTASRHPLNRGGAGVYTICTSFGPRNGTRFRSICWTATSSRDFTIPFPCICRRPMPDMTLPRVIIRSRRLQPARSSPFRCFPD
jgi:dTDP-4-amino-4,6-dideoxygalactose transaminase